MTEEEKTQLLALLDKAINQIPFTTVSRVSLFEAKVIVVDIMSEEEIDHRASTYEQEYAQ